MFNTHIFKKNHLGETELKTNRKDFKHTFPQSKFFLRLFPLWLALRKEFLHTLRTFTKILYMKGKGDN